MKMCSRAHCETAYFCGAMEKGLIGVDILQVAEARDTEGREAATGEAGTATIYPRP